MTKRELEPIAPERAKEMYLESRRHEVSESTLSGYHYRLKHFIRWCNVGQEVLDKHYDKRTEEQKVDQRRGYLEEL